MKNKIICRILVLSLILSAACVMTGCGCEHEWSGNICVEPEVCTKCSETRGEPQGHVYEEGSSVCSVCGEKLPGVGGKTPADFEAYNIPINMEPGVTYKLTQPASSEDASEGTVDTVEVRIDRVYSLDDNEDLKREIMLACSPVGEENLADVEGYSWYAVEYRYEHAPQSEFPWYYPAEHNEDYYDNAYHDDSSEGKSINNHLYYSRYSCVWNGEVFDQCIQITRKTSAYYDSNNYYVGTKQILFRIPDGYDGTVFGVHPYALSEAWQEGLYFRDLAGDFETFSYRLIP